MDTTIPLTQNSSGFFARLFRAPSVEKQTDWQKAAERRKQWEEAKEISPATTSTWQSILSPVMSILASALLLGGLVLVTWLAAWLTDWSPLQTLADFVQEWVLPISPIPVLILMLSVYKFSGPTLTIEPGRVGVITFLGGSIIILSKKLSPGPHSVWLPSPILKIYVFDVGGEHGGEAYDIDDIRGVTCLSDDGHGHLTGGTIELGNRRGDEGISVSYIPYFVDPVEAIRLSGQSARNGSLGILKRIEDFLRQEIPNALSRATYSQIEHTRHRDEIVMDGLRGIRNHDGSPTLAILGNGTEVILTGSGYGVGKVQVKEALAKDPKVISARSEPLMATTKANSLEVAAAIIKRMNETTGSNLEPGRTAMILLDHFGEEKIVDWFGMVGPNGIVSAIKEAFAGFDPSWVKDVAGHAAKAAEHLADHAKHRAQAGGHHRKSGGPGHGKRSSGGHGSGHH